MRVLTPDGLDSVTLRSSRKATDLSQYWLAVDHFLRTGDTRRLRPFRGKALRVGRRVIPYVTDPRTLDRLAHVGEVLFEDIYESQA